MAFRSIKTLEETVYRNRLRLADDGDSIAGVFLYNSYDDVLVADVHYINSRKYKGYVHCCGDGCPACKKGIRVQNKLFVPFLVLADKSDGYDENQVIFWDRNQPFVYQLRKDVFDKYPNPTEFIFRITRHGVYRDRNTRYSIMVEANCVSDINDVLSGMGVSFPEYYENIVKSVNAAELNDWINDSSSDEAYMPSANYSYQVKPRKRIADPEDLDALDDLPGEDVSNSVESTEESLPNVDLSSATQGERASTDVEELDVFKDANSEELQVDEDDCEPTF